MKLPNRENALIEISKITEYLLNINHERGGDKARLLIEFGYSRENWQQLENDIRQYHLEADVTKSRETIYGTRYEISAVLITPSGKSLLVTTAWQINLGKDYPRLITLVPD
jgi:predicted transcriptional regulator